ncbi:DUF4097 family beta strand repeat-containing protein [Nonomuraea jabiensis]|uniref:DUF4097 domain-containing protein n=1 Tax=Nonomuraea jabiensis TaxID=882448 RepID=A0A7W9FZQ1_9ACTN|nr:DUF4097 family beta strand repeat-containing protein [Nonomuraea jabiensis]MBB5774527.1 hypothetical protein [Nonomuraea jabiensis]
MRAAWLAAGALATAIALLLSTAGLWRGFARARMPEETTLRSIAFEHKDVRIKAGKGTQVNLTIQPGRAGELLIVRALRWSRDRPAVTEDWDVRSSTLRLDAVCPGEDQPNGPLCWADYVIYVPPETDVEAGTGKGRLTVSDLFGKLRLSSVAGDVEVNSLSGTLWVRSGTGNVDARDLDVEAADVEIGSGDVDLWFVSAPTTVNAVVRTAGDVNLDLPRTVYQVTAEGADTKIDVNQSLTSPRKIVVRAPKGRVSVCCD